MPENQYRLKYPRRRVLRFLFRFTLRPLIRILFRVKITGRKNFPKKGPLLVVGNHTAAMEGVLLNTFSPWQIEMLSAADIPPEQITVIVSNLYGVIPLHRGAYDRAALECALDVLKQGGVVGIFPEGGIWEEGKQQAFPGITWLSYQACAPVLPIGYNDTSGAMTAGLNFKRPTLSMNIGRVLPSAELLPGMSRKKYLRDFAAGVMEEVNKLIPVDETSQPAITNEEYQLEITLQKGSGENISIPKEYQIDHSAELAKFLHLPAVISIFIDNLQLPVDPIQKLHQDPKPAELITALQSILNYLSSENPYLLTYRFGVKTGLAMGKGLKELLRLLEWAFECGHLIKITPIKSYFSLKENREIIQREQSQYAAWM